MSADAEVGVVVGGSEGRRAKGRKDEARRGVSSRCAFPMVLFKPRETGAKQRVSRYVSWRKRKEEEDGEGEASRRFTWPRARRSLL